jgi:hypothetical protein
MIFFSELYDGPENQNLDFNQIMEKTNYFFGENAVWDSVFNKVTEAVASYDHQESKLRAVAGAEGF